ncbi:MAG: type ISP restriction/modification enzyme [Kiritimatiellia bacterium]
MGNPPYSAGQESANDNNQNVAYPDLDQSIRATYAAHSSATNKNALYDSYIRAIRWASDRVGKSGIIGYVTNAGFLEANTADGLRKCLAQEFSSIYVFHLRGNARTSGEVRRKEKDNVFGQGTRTPIAISILVKNPDAKQHGQIFWHDIGDYLSQSEKLAIVSGFSSLNGITNASGWTTIKPDTHHDWINQRDNSFEQFIKIGDKKGKNDISVFETYSSGIKTSRDTWCYNFSKDNTISNMQRMINFYHAELDRYKNLATRPAIDDFINTSPLEISWNRGLKNDFIKEKPLPFKPASIVKSLYRPFTKAWAYFDKDYNDMVYQMPKLFPNSTTKNFVIYMSGIGNAGKDSSVLIVNHLPDLNMQHSGGQGFPLYFYEKAADRHLDEDDLFATTTAPKTESGYTRKDGISDAGLAHFKAAYPGEAITKEDLFYYIYGLLHSPEYRIRYADNLSKELPRIPCVKQAADFWSFSQAGRDLADLHLNYETIACYPARLDYGKARITTLTDADYRVVKMKFARIKDAEGKSIADKTTVIYNPQITIRDIPLEAYDYIVNGKPALEWVMERQGVTTDKASNIVNDANLWAIETMHNAKYPLELLLRVITVSLETMKIVNSLPELDIV